VNAIPNVPLLKATLEGVETHPETHDQTKYRCGTKYCFAGRALVLAGLDNWISEDPESDFYDMLHPLPEERAEYDWGTPMVSPGRRAGRLLGLTGDQAHELFYAFNSVPKIREIVERIIRESGR
jgi:hypothetical protein